MGDEGPLVKRARINTELHQLVHHTYALMTSSAPHLNTIKLLGDHLNDVYKCMSEMQSLVAQHDLEEPLDLTVLDETVTATLPPLPPLDGTALDQSQHPIPALEWGIADLFSPDLYDQAHDSYNVPDGDGDGAGRADGAQASASAGPVVRAGTGKQPGAGGAA